jgi:hypothetical protein
MANKKTSVKRKAKTGGGVVRVKRVRKVGGASGVTRTKGVQSKDFVIAFLLDGIAGVEKLDATRTTTRANRRSVLLGALSQLKAEGRSVDGLTQYVESNFASQERGRALPLAGTTKDYKAQQIDKGGVFLRLPLTPLQMKKQGLVRVVFETDRIVVTKAV